jgi:transcriptional regulator with XRE-family HTH domain
MPVYSSHLRGYHDLNFGQRIREERQRKGLTLKELASRLDVSIAKVSQIETGQHVLELRQASSIADALDIPLVALLPPDVSIPYQLARESSVRSLPPRTASLVHSLDGSRETDHNQFWPLADLFIGRHMEPTLGRIMSLADDQLRFCYHHEQEFVFALRGTIDFVIHTPQGELHEELHRGDCMLFRSDFPHCFRSLESEPAESIQISASATAPINAGWDSLNSQAISYIEHGEHNNELSHLVGEKLGILRQTHGWGRDAVAQTVGLTSRQLEQIERGERAVPLDALFCLARRFGKPLSEFIRRTPECGPYYFVQRSADIPGIASRNRRRRLERPDARIPPLTYRPLAGGFPTRGMFPYLIGIPNVGIDALTFHEHHGQEFIYVLDGQVEFTTYAEDRQVHETLHPGDSCYIDSSVPHLVRGETRNPYSDTSAEIICVFWCPLGETYIFEDQPRTEQVSIPCSVPKSVPSRD